MPQPSSWISIIAWSPSQRVRTVITPLASASRSRSSIACAALTTMLRNTWLSSFSWHTTVGSSPRSVRTSATYLYSLRATASVVSSARLMSAATCSGCATYANSFIARTIDDTRSRPNIARETAIGICSDR